MLAQINPTVLTEYMGTQFEVLDDLSKVFCLTLTNIVEHLKTERLEAFSLFFMGRLTHSCYKAYTNLSMKTWENWVFFLYLSDRIKTASNMKLSSIIWSNNCFDRLCIELSIAKDKSFKEVVEWAVRL